MPVSRARVMLMAGRSRGRPRSLLRRASVTNSSISLPACRVTPRMMAPAASSGVGPLAAKASGLRNAAIRPICDPSCVTGWKFGAGGAEGVDGVRELRDDRRIDGKVEPVRREEGVDLGLDGAGELLEHEVLVLHLGGELRGLEQALGIPHGGG